MRVYNKLLTIGILTCALPAFASDVYIDQAGSSSTIDIVQTGNGNLVGNSTTATTLTGNSQDIDITQTGNSNKTDISTDAGSNDTDIAIVNTGDSNETVIGIASTGTEITSTITGDSNLVTVCGTNDGSGKATTGTVSGSGSSVTQSGTIAGCTTEVAVVDTKTTIVANGDYNSINMELDAADAVNNITVGGTASSSFNSIDILQDGNDSPKITMTVDGNSNVIDIKQN